MLCRKQQAGEYQTHDLDDYAFQCGAALESSIPNQCHTARNCNALQCNAVSESKNTDLRHTVRNYNAFERSATFKSRYADLCHAFRNRDTFQCGTVFKGICSNLCYAVRNCNPGCISGVFLQNSVLHLKISVVSSHFYPPISA